MRSKLALLGIFLSLNLLACSPPAANPNVQTPREQMHLPSPPVSPPATTNQAQNLPISARLVVARETINLEVAKTPPEQSKGLMFRTYLAPNRGMLFPFDPPRPVRFWMKNTLIPLDMVFLRDGVIQKIETNVPPCKSDTCPNYGPDKETIIDLVLEIPAGRAGQLGLKAGDRLKFEYLK